MSDNEATLETQSPPKGNDEISSSAQEALGVETVDDTPPQQDSDDTLDHKERSRLGRRFTKFEQEIDGLKQTIQQMTSVINQRSDPYVDRAIAPDDDKPPVEYITTPQDLEAYEEWRGRQIEKKRNAYANRYVHGIKSMSYMNNEMHAEIENELLTNTNEYPTYTKFNDPIYDAKENYLRAENKLLKQKLVGAQVPKPNVRGGSNIPSGVSTTTRINATPKATVKLDEYASKFVRAMGESEDSDWVQKSVARNE
jgi:hypothetical protein